MADESITLGTILEHLHALETRINARFDKADSRFDRLEQRVDRMDRNLSGQIDAIDRRLDTVEIGQLRIERHLGLSPVR